MFGPGRGTTCYLVQRRIDMLPKPLTEDICSLRADVERLAFSVLWEMTDDARIISTRFVLPFHTSFPHGQTTDVCSPC